MTSYILPKLIFKAFNMSDNFKVYFNVFFVAFVLSACGKYEDGPMFSLRTKTARITGEWELISFNEGNEIIFNSYVYAESFGDCGVQTVNSQVEKQQNVIWDIESDTDIKERYNRVKLEIDMSQSFQPPSCQPVYNTVDSSQTYEEKRWTFQNDKKEIVTIVPYGIGREYQILRLTNSEMHLEDAAGNILKFQKRD